MISEVKRKAKSFFRSFDAISKKENLSLYHIFVFATSKRGRRYIIRMFSTISNFALQRFFGIPPKFEKDYQKWMKLNFPTPTVLEQFKKEAAGFSYQPVFSVVLPIYNTPMHYLKDAIDSVIAQTYPHWELCISDDCSPNGAIRDYVETLAAKDKRIKFVWRDTNGHISENTNSAIALASGDFIAFMDHDDYLRADALFQNAKVLNENKQVELLYSDEDKVNDAGAHFKPRFKPDWCPDGFLSQNYLCHFVVVKRDIVNEIGGLRKGFEGSQDYDFLLRATEKTSHIYHIPMILYHWRSHEGSVAQNNYSKPYAFEAGKKAIEEALVRRGRPGTVTMIGHLKGLYSVRYKIKEYKKVSIVIPTKNKADLCEDLLSSIFELTVYPDFEVILVDNNSDEDSFFELIKKWEVLQPKRFKCIKDVGDFNFSRLINNGVKATSGAYLLLLNNDMKIIDKDWMNALVEQVQFETTGIVGAKLIYKNERIQHAGMVLGMKDEISRHPSARLDRDFPGNDAVIITINNYSSITGACMMVRAEIFKQVGGFDEAIPVDYNDLDFCLKVRELGLNNIYLPHVTLFHYESVSRSHPKKSRKSHLVFEQSAAIIRKKWAKYIEHDPCISPHLIYEGNEFNIQL